MKTIRFRLFDSKAGIMKNVEVETLPISQNQIQSDFLGVKSRSL